MRGAPANGQQKQRAEGETAVAPDEKPATVEDVGGVSGEEKQDDAGCKLGQADVSEIERALGDFVNLPSHGNGLHLDRHDDEESGERVGDEVGIGEGDAPG